MDKLILLFIGAVCIWYFYRKLFKSGGGGCHCDGCGVSCSNIDDEE